MTNLWHRMRTDDRGFTLIELLVVIVVLGACDCDPIISASARGRTSPLRRPTSRGSPGHGGYNADHSTGYTGVTLTKLRQSTTPR